jgi:hypothetical protein
MTLLSICQWVQSTEFFTALRSSWYVYPVVMSLHLAGIALFGGMVLAVELRLLGVAMRKRPVADVVCQLRALQWAGFLMVATCGILMFGSKAEEYYYNAFFRAKMVILSLIAVDPRARQAGRRTFADSVDRHGDRGARHRVHRAAA